jgi:hypothetical protein
MSLRQAALAPSSGPAPDLIVNVTGSVLNGPSVMANSDKPDTKPQDLPRKFHEMFLLRAAEQGEGMQPKVRLVSSSLSGFVVDVQRSMGYTARTSGLLDKGTGTSRM